jgi:hypothetical protein
LFPERLCAIPMCLEDYLPDFFSPSEWPTFCHRMPDLNSFNYFAWEYTLAKLSCKKHMTLAKFKTRSTQKMKYLKYLNLTNTNQML